MSKISLFVKSELRKITATAIVAVAFLYFWINGPILQAIEVLSLESIETKYSMPVMVGSEGVDNDGVTSFHTLDFSKEGSFGHGLILEKKTRNDNWGFIGDVKNNPGLSEDLQAKILNHASEFSETDEVIDVLPSMDMYYATVSSDKRSPNIYLESTEVVKNIRGYAGEISVGVFLDEAGNITRVEHIASKETQSYLADMKKSGFYDQFNLISILDGEQEIDGVSGATLTSEAIASTVSQLIKEGTPFPISNYSDVDEVNLFGLETVLSSTWIFHVGVIFLMFVFAIQNWIKKSKKQIIVLSILSVLYLGFFLNNSFTYVSFIHPFVGTTVSSLVGLYSLFVLLGAIWGKNTYCKYVCPFGNIQRLLIQVTPVKVSRKFFMSNKWISRIRAALSVILLTGVLLGLRSWSNFELFPDLFGLSVLSVWLVVAVVTILTALVYPMIWCRLLCPTGSLLDGLSDLVNYKKGKTFFSFQKK